MIGSLFTGYGGLDLAVEQVTGERTAWVSDIDPGACRILAERFPGAPNLGDISGIDWATVPPVRILTGGFPCQDVSMAGRRAGFAAGSRSGLWSMMAGAIDALRPDLVVAENVRGLLSADGHADLEPCPGCMGDPEVEPVLRALGAVLGDLADVGYDAAWHGVTAAAVGAPHERFRVFVVAWPTPDTRSETGGFGTGLRAGGPGRQRRGRPDNDAGEAADPGGSGLEDRRAGATELELTEPVGGRATTADTYRDGLEFVGRQQPVERHIDGRCRQDGTRDHAEPPATADPGRKHRQPRATIPASTRHGRPADQHQRPAPTNWGPYEPAIRRWATVLGRPAPPPTLPGPTCAQRLSPRFVEWMMGLPAGWVTDLDLTRNQQLKALGNGVVPQQAVAALRVLLPVAERYAS